MRKVAPKKIPVRHAPPKPPPKPEPEPFAWPVYPVDVSERKQATVRRRFVWTDEDLAERCKSGVDQEESVDDLARDEGAAVVEAIAAMTGWTKEQVELEAVWRLLDAIENFYWTEDAYQPHAVTTPAPNVCTAKPYKRSLWDGRLRWFQAHRGALVGVYRAHEEAKQTSRRRRAA